MDKKTVDEGDRLLIQRVLVVKNASSEHQPFDEKYLWTLFSQHNPQVAVFQHDEICVPAVGLVRFNSPREACKAKRTFPSLNKLKEKEQEGLGLNILDFDPSKQYAVFDAHKLAERILQQEKQSLAAVSCYGGGWVTTPPGLVVGHSAYGLVSGSLPSPPGGVQASPSASCPPLQTYFSPVVGQGEVMPHYGQGVVGPWSVPYHQPGNLPAAVVVVGPPHQAENSAAGPSQPDYTSLVSAPCSGYMADPASTLYDDLSAPGADAASCQPWFPRDASRASPQPATAVTAVPASGNADASPASWCYPRVSDSASDARLALPNASHFTTVPRSSANVKTQALHPTILAARMSQNHGRRVENPQVQISTSNPSSTTLETLSSTASAEPSYICSAPFNTGTTSQTISRVYVSTAQSTRVMQNPTLATATHQDPVTAFSGHSSNITLPQTSRAQIPSPFQGQTTMMSSTQPMGFIEFQQHLTQLANSLASQSLSVAACSGQSPQLTNQNHAPVAASADLWRQHAGVHGVSGSQVVDPPAHWRGPFAPEVSCGYSFYPPSVPVSSHAAQSLGLGHAETTQGHSQRNLVKMHSMTNMPHCPRVMNTGSTLGVPPAVCANATSEKQHAGYPRAMFPHGVAMGGRMSTVAMPPTTQQAEARAQMMAVNQRPTFFSIGQQMVNGQSFGLCAVPGFWQASSGQLFPLEAAGVLNPCNSWAAPTCPTMSQLQGRPVPPNNAGASWAGSASLPLMRSQRTPQSPPCHGGSRVWGSAGSQQQGTGLRRCKSSCSFRRREPSAFLEPFAPIGETNPPKGYQHHHQRPPLTKSETKALKAVARAMSDSQKSAKTAKGHHNPGHHNTCQLYLKPSEVVDQASTSGGGDPAGRHAPCVPLTSEPSLRVTRIPEVGPATSVTRSAAQTWSSDRRAGSERCAVQDVSSSNHCDRVVFGPANGLVEKLR